MTDNTSTASRRLRFAGRGAALVGLALAFVTGLCVGEGAAPVDDAAQAESDVIWTCPMHSQIRKNKPGKCPICGMELVELGRTVRDPRRISLTERAQALARIRTARVEPLVANPHQLRLLGRVDYDETRLKSVTAWTAGRIDRLRVATTGQRIRAGQVIADVYSPEIYAAHADLVAAAKHAEKLAGATEVAREAAVAAVAAARQRLLLLGVPTRDVDAMAAADAPSRQIPIRTPMSGTVIERLVTEGSYVAAGAALYRVADLSRMWVQLDAYEADLPHLAVGATAKLDIAGIPGETVTGEVTFIDPVLDPRTRTVRVRVEVVNPDGRLRPGMYAEAQLDRAAGDVGADAPNLMIPASAALFTGKRSIVYVEIADAEAPTYQAREVVLGARAGDMYPVISGLELGERVVVQGAFVLDADLQIQGGASMMTTDDDAIRRLRAPIQDTPAALREALGALIAAYLDAQEALAADDLPAARGANQAILSAIPRVSRAMPARLRERWQPLTPLLEGYAGHLARADDITRARRAFEGVSEQIIELMRRFGNPTGAPIHVAYCPMAFDNRGAAWIQRSPDIHNAYFGADMPACGDIRGALGPGAQLDDADSMSEIRTQGGAAKDGASAGHQR